MGDFRSTPTSGAPAAASGSASAASQITWPAFYGTPSGFLSDTDYYTMPDLNMTALPDEGVPRGGCAVGDILYVLRTGSSHATNCVVVTRVTPAQVHTEGVLGAAHFYVEPGDQFADGTVDTADRMLQWTPDTGRRTGKTTIFRWSPAKGAYINDRRALVRCADAPAANYGKYKG